MKRPGWLARLAPALVPLAVIGFGAAVLAGPAPAPVPTIPSPVSADNLASPENFADIADPQKRSAAYFTELGKVLTSRRCLNCHPAGDRPRQGDDGHPHQPPVFRGKDGFGLDSLRCPICHANGNFPPGRMPGHPEWHLAPREMGWEGKTLTQICEQIKDPKRNGNRTLKDLEAHIGEDTLVGWAWHPGFGRKPAPGTQSQAGALVKAWADSGAFCP
jgi:hypothetical protein